MINASLGATLGKSYMQARMDVIANNLANINTVGYKASKFFLTDNSLATYIDFSQGPLLETKNTLDLAIEGDGFFVVMTPHGEAYTRAGHFTLNAEKKLVMQDGQPLLGENGEIYLDGFEIKVESDGSIFADNRFIDRLKIVDFEDKTFLRPIGKGLYLNENRKVEKTPKEIKVKQGYLEGSNVDTMRELVDLIAVLRAYETYTKVEQIQSETKSKLLDTLRF